EGRKPQTAAGIRREPPVSEPVQTGSMSQASATAAPPDDPPALSRGSNGLPVAPQTTLRVFAPAPNSGTLVLATMIAPALGRQRPGVIGTPRGKNPPPTAPPFPDPFPATNPRWGGER